METTEKIVESYCRYVKNWFTIPNIKCSGQYEIDLLAIDSKADGSISRYHIETSVSISGSFSKLNADPFSPEKMKERVEKPKQRRTIGYFIERKFSVAEVLHTIRQYGFFNDNYQKIIVSWGWTDEAQAAAEEAGIVLWDFRKILKEIADSCNNKKYFIDDTLRTIQLFHRAVK